MDVKVNNKVVDTVEAGNTFGELNLLFDQDAMPTSDSDNKIGGDKKTTGTTIVVPDRTKSVKVLRLNQKSYRGIVQAQTKAEEADKLDLVEKNPMLKSMIPKNDKRNNNVTAKKLTSIMKPLKIEKDKVLVDNEKVGDTFFVVQDGHIRVTTAANQAATYGPGDCFGKRALGTNTNEPTEVRITGLDNGNVYSIDKKTLDKVLGENHLARTKAKAQDTKKLVRISSVLLMLLVLRALVWPIMCASLLEVWRHVSDGIGRKIFVLTIIVLSFDCLQSRRTVYSTTGRFPMY